MITIYFHPSCATSYEVIRGLKAAGALEKVRLVRTVSPSAALAARVWSVPWVTIDGAPVATDPTSADEVLAILRGERVDVGDAEEAFMTAVLHSSFASAVALLHGDVKPVVDEEFVSAALRAPLSGADVKKAAEAIRSKSSRLFEEWRDKIRRALAVSFVREAYWASGGAITPEGLEGLASPLSVGLWVIGKASIGRSALPAVPSRPPTEDFEAIASFVRRSARGLLLKVAEEQRAIYSDAEYLKLVESLPDL